MDKQHVQSTTTRKFLRAIGLLIKSGEAKSEYAIAKKMGYKSAAVITEVKKGRHNIGMIVIRKFVQAYPNYEWVAKGEEPVEADKLESFFLKPQDVKEVLKEFTLITRELELIKREVKLISKQVDIIEDRLDNGSKK